METVADQVFRHLSIQCNQTELPSTVVMVNPMPGPISHKPRWSRGNPLILRRSDNVNRSPSAREQSPLSSTPSKLVRRAPSTE